MVEFVGRADRTLELALYDVRLPDPTGSLVADALKAAAQRGVSVRLIYNLDHDRVIAVPPFAGKPSTPYQPGSAHDFMHAKVTVADDTLFTGSFNLSHSGEMNAENVLEIHDPRLADQLADFIDRVRASYPTVPVPEIAGSGGLAIGSR